MNTKFKQIIVAVLLCGFGATASAAAIINVDDNGRLLGASGIDVNGALFDVEFVDGSCADIFTECGAASGTSFVFGSDIQATAASEALWNHVVVPFYFGGDPLVMSIDGCTAGERVPYDACYLVTPFAREGDVFHAKAIYLPDLFGGENLGDLVVGLEIDLNIDATANNFTFAVWSRVGDPIDVPEPTTLALLGLGLVGMGMRRRIKAG